MDTSDARNNQPDRKHERAPTPDAARPPRHAPDPTHESRVLVVLHPLSPPPASSNNPGHHAHRHTPRKRLTPRPSNPPNHRHHPRQGRRNMLQPTPPHHPLPQHLELTPDQHVLSYNPTFRHRRRGDCTQRGSGSFGVPPPSSPRRHGERRDACEPSGPLVFL